MILGSVMPQSGAEGKTCLFHVQDADRPMFILGDNWLMAIEKWRQLIRQENDLAEDEPCEPNGITLVADPYELLL